MTVESQKQARQTELKIFFIAYIFSLGNIRKEHTVLIFTVLVESGLYFSFVLL